MRSSDAELLGKARHRFALFIENVTHFFCYRVFFPQVSRAAVARPSNQVPLLRKRLIQSATDRSFAIVHYALRRTVGGPDHLDMLATPINCVHCPACSSIGLA